MIRVVIVEDEMLIRLGTKLCLEEYEQEIRVAETFETGEAAIEYFKNHTADVLITDIKLTGISGLELVREIRKDHMGMKIVVLSCYEDFSYAREAMELGVEKYILKHELTGDELPRLVQELGKEAQFTQNKKEFSRKVIVPEEQICEMQGYVLGCLVLRGEQDAQNSTSEQLNFNILVELIQKLLNVNKLGECFLRHEEDVFIVFQMAASMRKEEFEAKIGNFFERLSRNIFNYFNKKCFLFLSEQFQELNEIPKIYTRVKNLSIYSFYYEEHIMIPISEIESRIASCPKVKVKMEGIYSPNWFEENEKMLHIFFEEARRNLFNVVQVKAEIVKYYYALEEGLPEIFPKERLKGLKDYTGIDAFDSGKMLEKWLIELLQEIKGNVMGVDLNLQRMKEYIESHYMEEVSLEQIADDFHMSMPYFCQYFKKNMGVSFVTYLNGFRIQRAKELMRDKTLSTEQIADAIGMKNANYFIRLFKKHTGMTVSAYRKTLKF